MHVSISTTTPPLDTVIVLSYNSLTQYIDLNFIKGLKPTCVLGIDLNTLITEDYCTTNCKVFELRQGMKNCLTSVTQEFDDYMDQCS